MFLSDVSVRRPVLAVVLSLLLVVLGVMSFLRLPLREVPNIDPPIVSVNVNYNGASAAVVETRITQVLEDAVQGIAGIDTIESRSRNGRADVTITFALSRDIEAAANDVRDAISRVVDNLPQEADPPDVAKVEGDADVILWLNLTSDRMDTLSLTDYAERFVVDRLSTIDVPGTRAVRWGGAEFALVFEKMGQSDAGQRVGEFLVELLGVVRRRILRWRHGRRWWRRLVSRDRGVRP